MHQLCYEKILNLGNCTIAFNVTVYASKQIFVTYFDLKANQNIFKLKVIVLNVSQARPKLYGLYNKSFILYLSVNIYEERDVKYLKMNLQYL